MINLKIDTYTRELLQLHYLSGFREISVSRKHFCNKQKKNLAILASDHIGWQHFVFFSAVLQSTVPEEHVQRRGKV